MYKFFLQSAAVAAILTFATSTYAETLLEVYQQALQNDHQYRAAEAAYKSGKLDKAISRSGLLPQISAQATWRDTLRSEPWETAETRVSATLTQRIFNLAAWYNFKIGSISAKTAAANFQSAKQELIIRTAQTYFDALEAIDNFETAKAEENALKHQLEQTQKRFEVGLTAITEVHESQAVYDSSVADRLLSEGQMHISFEALEVITGRPYDQLSPLKEQFPIAPPEPIERKSWVEFALKNNLSLLNTSLLAESAEQRVKEKSSAYAPTLGGSLSTSSRNERNGVKINESTVGLTFDLPIFTGGNTTAAYRKEKQNAIQARENYLFERRNTVQRARTLHLTALTNVATVKARMQAITSNQSALDATQAGYDVGTRDLVDVLNAQRNLFRARRDYLNTLYTYVIDNLRLKQVAGILTSKDVESLDSWLDKNKKISRNN